MVVVIMGPAGSGKTTVGSALAKAIGWDFHDADEFHSAASIAKMEQGHALTDSDRMPWLAAMHEAIATWTTNGTQNVVLACSALKHEYRGILASGQESHVRFVYLKASRELLEARLRARAGHFMKANMLVSQLQALEEPDETEAIILDASQTVDDLVVAARGKLAI